MTTWTCRCGQVNPSLAPCGACLNPPPPGMAARGRPSRYRQQAIPPALVIGVVATLVAGLLAAAFIRPEPVARIDPAARRAAAALKALLPELSAFVESARGLRFKEPVDVVLLDGRAFRQRLRDVQTIDPDELEADEAVLRALELIEPDVDLAEEIDSLLGAAVAGFYDPESKALVIRGAKLTVGVRITLVHELTHALQDQHFDLDRDELDKRRDESAQGFGGLVEGDAVRIQNAYRDSLPLEEQKAAEREQVLASAGVGLGISPVLLQMLVFPYAAGPTFAAKLVEVGGQARVDAAFAEPPTTSEHLLHPDRFLAGERAHRVDRPRARGEVIDHGVLGEIGLLLLFANSLRIAGDALEAAAGWGGDHYVAWRDDDRACVSATIVMDTPDDTRQLRDALVRWAADHDDARVSGTGPVSFTACG